MLIGAHAIIYGSTIKAGGMLTQVTLPGGGKLGAYQPRLGRPDPMK